MQPQCLLGSFFTASFIASTGRSLHQLLVEPSRLDGIHRRGLVGPIKILFQVGSAKIERVFNSQRKWLPLFLPLIWKKALDELSLTCNASEKVSLRPAIT